MAKRARSAREEAAIDARVRKLLKTPMPEGLTKAQLIKLADERIGAVNDFYFGPA